MIAPEGRLAVSLLLAGACAVAYLGELAWSSPLFGLAGAAAWLFRDPLVRRSGRPLAVVCPASGRVQSIEAVVDPWLERPALRIAIALRFPGICVIHSPVGGRVRDYWTDLEPGKAAAGAAAEPEDVSASFPQLLASPTQYALALETEGVDAVVYCVSSRSRHSRLKFDNAPGERVSRGQRSGFVYLASRVDLLVPRTAHPEVAPGQRVRGGHDIVATLVRR